MFKKSLLGSIVFHLLLLAGLELGADHPDKFRAAPPPSPLIMATLDPGSPSDTPGFSRDEAAVRHHQKTAVGPEQLLLKDRRERTVSSMAAEATPPRLLTDREKTETEIPVAEPGEYGDGATDGPGHEADGSGEMGTISSAGDRQGPDLALQPDRLPVKLHGPSPAYPLKARQNNWEGVTVLEIWIQADGLIGEVTVLQSSGYSLLDHAAVTAVKEWRYRPALKKGIAVACRARVRIKFVLEE